MGDETRTMQDLADEIDRLRRLEVALEESERRFRALVTAIPDLIFRCRADGTFLDYEPSSHFEPSVPPEQFLGKKMSDVMPAEVAEAGLAAIGRALRTGIDQAIEYQLPKEDRLRYYEARISSCGPDEIVAIVRDDTERRHAEEAATRIGRILDESLNEIYMFDAATLRFVRVNRGARRNLGYTLAELRRLTPLDLKPEFTANSFFELLRPLWKGEKERVRFTTVHLRKDGSRYPVEVHVQRSALEGEPVYLAIILDISEREEIERSSRRSEAAYRAVFEHAPYGIYRSAGGRFLSANPALVRMLGYASERDLLALDLATDVYESAHEREDLIAKYGDAERVSDVEVRWKRGDGRPITVRLNGRAVHGDSGELQCFEMFVEDITNRRALEAQLMQAQKMEGIGQLTGGIAHDFNNILTVMQANAEAVIAGIPDDQPELHAGLEELQAAARRGTALVRRLLGFSRQAMLLLKPVALTDFLNEFLGTIGRLLPAGIEIQYVSPDPLPPIQADPGAIEQILINLVTNARDAMPDGGVLRIETTLASLDETHKATRGWGEPGDYVCLTVTDSGAGMDVRTREKIFEPFFTTKPPGQGTGLGMAMLYGLVKQHRGYVDLSSVLGEGTAIKVFFQLATEPATVSHVGRTAGEPQPGTETLLLAEDEAPIRRAAKRVLERYGYTVLLAANGQEALDLFREHREAIGLVISDLVMPKMGGRDLYTAIQWEAPTTKFLFTSGYSSKEKLALGKLPASAFIQKPWTVSDLLLKVRDMLDR